MDIIEKYKQLKRDAMDAEYDHLHLGGRHYSEQWHWADGALKGFVICYAIENGLDNRSAQGQLDKMADDKEAQQ